MIVFDKHPMDKSYQNIMIDPPWPQHKGGLREVRPNQGRTLDYQTLTMAEIAALLDREILPLGSPSGHNIWLWTIDKFLVEAESIFLEREYKRHVRLIWDKENGPAPSFTLRFSHEYLIWFYKPRLIPVAKDMRGKMRSVFRCKGREHSRKPDEAYEMIASLYPETQRLDVFSREARLGWDQWGDQTNFFVADVHPGLL